jgi:hypothetical protein
VVHHLSLKTLLQSLLFYTFKWIVSASIELCVNYNTSELQTCNIEHQVTWFQGVVVGVIAVASCVSSLVL